MMREHRTTKLTANKALPMALVISHVYTNLGMTVLHEDEHAESSEQADTNEQVASNGAAKAAASDQAAPTSTDGANATDACAAGSTSSQVAQPAASPPTPPPPETYLELLCRNQVLPITMSLATVKQFYWKASELMQLTYRRTAATALMPATFKPKPIATPR